MAETILCREASARGLAAQLEVDSAGIGAVVGFDMDRRARQALERRGYRPVNHVARQFEPAWLNERDLVVAMDRHHLRWLQRHGPAGPQRARVRLLLSYLPDAKLGDTPEVPDPYYGVEKDFESCLDLIQAGCLALLDELGPALGPG